MARWSEDRKVAMDAMVRETICEATVRVLNEQGLEGVTMDRVAVEGGVAKGTLYNHFANKEDLLTQVHRQLFEPLKGRIFEISELEGDPREKIRGMLEETAHFCRRNRSILRMLAQSGVHKADATVEKREVFLLLLERLVEDGIQSGVFRRTNARRMAEMLHGAAVAFVDARIADSIDLDVEGEVHTLMEFFLHGLCGGHGRDTALKDPTC